MANDGLKESKPWPIGSLIFMSVFVAIVCTVVAMFNTHITPVRFKMPTTAKLPEVLPMPSAELIAKGSIKGPANLAFGKRIPTLEEEADGIEPTDVVYTTLADGRMVEIDLDTHNVTEIIVTGNPKRLAPSWNCGEYYTEVVCGRPTGIAFDQDAIRLYVLDSYEGVFLVDRIDKKKELLADEVTKNDKFSYVSDIVVSKITGKVYFTETSTKHKRRDHSRPVFEAASTGRLLQFDPEDGSIEVLQKKLVSPTGITLVEDPTGSFDEFVLIAETPRSRVKQYNLENKKRTKAAMARDPFVSSLPVLPRSLQFIDNHLWVLGNQRRPWQDQLSQYPELRKIVYLIPDWLLQMVSPAEIMLLKINRKGKIVAAMRDEEGRPYLRAATHFQVIGDSLYLSSDSATVDHISKVLLPKKLLE